MAVFLFLLSLFIINFSIGMLGFVVEAPLGGEKGILLLGFVDELNYCHSTSNSGGQLGMKNKDVTITESCTCKQVKTVHI